jgi:hypothetical protein
MWRGGTKSYSCSIRNFFFLFYAKSSRLEKKPWFKEDEVTVGREAEVEQARWIKLHAAKKRKAEAIEGARVRYDEKQAKDQREGFEAKHLRDETSPPVLRCNTLALSRTPFITPPGAPILVGDLLHYLKTVIASGQYRNHWVTRKSLKSCICTSPHVLEFSLSIVEFASYSFPNNRSFIVDAFKLTAKPVKPTFQPGYRDRVLGNDNHILNLKNGWTEFSIIKGDECR